MRPVMAMLVLLAAAPAFADEDKAKPIAPAAPASSDPAPVQSPLDHTGQFGVSLRVALGLRAIAPLDDSVYCGKTDASAASGYAPVCVGRSPFSLDLEASYGLRAKLDAILEIRLGIESDFGSSPNTNDGPHIVAMSPGVRFFFSEAKRTKLFSTAQIVLDFSGYKDPSGIARRDDFGVRNLNGLWFELDKSYAAYIYGGETLTFVRWLGFELEVGLGFQARY